MPILGYGGYIPFAWELFALYQLVAGALGFTDQTELVQVNHID